MAKHVIVRGQRYREFLSGLYGPLASEWIVEELQTDGSGIQHARLVSASNSTVRKTFAVEVLGDLRRFELL